MPRKGETGFDLRLYILRCALEAHAQLAPTKSVVGMVGRLVKFEYWFQPRLTRPLSIATLLYGYTKAQIVSIRGHNSEQPKFHDFI